MKELIIAILLFIVGLVLLIKGGDWFVDGSTEIAEIFKIPEILIGATIVAIGTTLPEVMVSATSALSGHGEISYGNAIGSVICNTSLIAALTIAIRPTGTDKKSLLLPTIFFFASAVAYALVAYFFGKFYRFMGIILLLAFCLYLFLSAKDAKKTQTISPTETENETLSEKEKKKKIIKDIILLVVGAALITVGANLLVDNGTIIAKGIGVPESVIALTFIALGTSLPELVTAVTALIKGHSSLSLGNLIGANLFNIVFVSGTAITLSSSFAVPTQAFFGFNRSLIIDIPVMFAVMLILTLPPLIKGKLYRWQGIALLGIYAAFCAVQFAL